MKTNEFVCKMHVWVTSPPQRAATVSPNRRERDLTAPTEEAQLQPVKNTKWVYMSLVDDTCAHLVKACRDSSCLRCWESSFFSRDRRIQALARPTSVFISDMLWMCLGRQTTERERRWMKAHTKRHAGLKIHPHLSNVQWLSGVVWWTVIDFLCPHFH